MTTDADALLQAAVDGEPDARLVYADFLEGMGDGFRAEFWRTDKEPRRELAISIEVESGYS